FDRPRRHPLYHALRCALLNNGVDCSMFHGWISAVHTEEDLALTVQRYERALESMAADGWFKGI
ncbi:MAG: aspartate aminotransferase family protein, partial [Candidatus Rokubacteria bacterium]|nr:aspartate aminotransferase family protein [Candidatus Rokubacteria bacterium]